MHTTNCLISSDSGGRPGVLLRRSLKSHVLATSIRCQHRIASGVNSMPTSSSRLRPRIKPFTASRRRWSSSSRIRFFPNLSLTTQFSVSRYAMTSCCCRFTQPARITRYGCQGYETNFMPALLARENTHRASQSSGRQCHDLSRICDLPPTVIPHFVGSCVPADFFDHPGKRIRGLSCNF